MTPKLFFESPENIAHRQYEALRALFYEGKSAQEVAQQFGYRISTLYSLARDFKSGFKQGNCAKKQFFVESKAGRKPHKGLHDLRDLIVTLRKKYLSVENIKSILDAHNKKTSESTIYKIIRAEGFARLPRRNRLIQEQTKAEVTLIAPPSHRLEYADEQFTTGNAGILSFIPYHQQCSVGRAITSEQ